MRIGIYTYGLCAYKILESLPLEVKLYSEVLSQDSVI